MSRGQRLLVGLAFTTPIVVNACRSADGVSPGTRAPTISAVLVAPNAFNALALTVTARVSGADSMRLMLRSPTDADVVTPYTVVTDGPVRLAALGLHAATTYTVTAEAIGAGVTTTSPSVQAATGNLPAAIRTLHLVAIGSSPPGYTLVVPIFGEPDGGAFVVAFDGAGEIRWYRAFFGEGWAVEAKQQRDGSFTTYLGRSYGWQGSAGRFVQFAPTGEEVGSFRVAQPAFTDPHELLLSFDGARVTAVHMLGYTIDNVDLQSVGGSPVSFLAQHTIVRERPDGSTEFMWRAADVFSIADWPSVTPTPPDLVHPSSLALDIDGNYIVSMQGMDEITKVNASTGAVMWRLGGKHSGFTILDDPLGGFSGQHSVRVLDNGNLLILDNRARVAGASARVAEYQLDPVARAARLVWEYRPDPPVPSPMLGSVQRLRDGGTLVGFGVTGRIDEVDANGKVHWSAVLTQDTPAGDHAVQLYRAIRVSSLYSYRAP